MLSGAFCTVDTAHGVLQSEEDRLKSAQLGTLDSSKTSGDPEHSGFSSKHLFWCCLSHHVARLPAPLAGWSSPLHCGTGAPKAQAAPRTFAERLCLPLEWGLGERPSQWRHGPARAQIWAQICENTCGCRLAPREAGSQAEGSPPPQLHLALSAGPGDAAGSQAWGWTSVPQLVLSPSAS